MKWLTIGIDADHVVVLPESDLIEHSRSDDCPCGPSTEPVVREDGTVAWMYTHHSLDGRELVE